MSHATEVSESLFKERVKRDLDKLEYIWYFKTQERSIRGIPDIIGCWKGMFFAIELKRVGEKPTPLQEQRLKAIWVTAGYAFWADPSNWDERLRDFQANMERSHRLLHKS